MVWHFYYLQYLKGIKSGLASCIIIVICFPAYSQVNRYQTPAENHLQQYVPINMDYLIQAGAAIQARSDAAQAYRDKLIDYIFDVKSKTNDRLLLSSMDNYYQQLKALDGQRLDIAESQLLIIKNGIMEAIDASRNRDREEQHKIVESPSINYLTSYSANLTRGNKFFDSGEYSFALADYNRSIELNPDNAEAYAKRGALRLVMEDFVDALYDFTMELRFMPSSKAFLNRGMAKLKLKNYDGAIGDNTKAISLDSHNSMAFANRGVAKYKKHLYKAALVDVNRALLLNESNPSALELKYLIRNHL